MIDYENIFSYIRQRTDFAPRIGLILGSGLGGFVDQLSESFAIKYSDIPDFPVSTVEGHEGAFVFGNIQGIPLIVMQGRLHYYEGYSLSEVTCPIRIMKKLGVHTLIITNASGGINLSYSPGTLMIISDHINLTGLNPLIGANMSEFGPRFPDVSDIYTKCLRTWIKDRATQEGINVPEGVYNLYIGPSFETAAEIKALRLLGADVTGMSTVPEAIVAAHCGLKVVGISCVTNMATGVLDTRLDHKDIVGVADRVKNDFTQLLQISIQIADNDTKKENK